MEETQQPHTPAMTSPAPAADPSRRWRSTARVLAWVASVAVGFALGIVVQRDSKPPQAVAGPPWWRTSFPPRFIEARPLAEEPRYDPSLVVSGVACGNLDGVRVEADGGLFIWGWAKDPRRALPARAVLVLAGKEPVSPSVHVDRERPDVAEATHSPALLASGWRLWVPVAKRPGVEQLSAYAVLLDGGLCSLGSMPIPAKVAQSKAAIAPQAATTE